MNKIITLAFIIATLAVSAQNNKIRKERNDTTVFLWGDLKILVMNNHATGNKPLIDTNITIPVKPVHARFYEGIDIGVNGLLGPSNFSTNLSGAASNMDINYSGSYNLHLNIIEKQIHLYKKRINLVTGLGFDFNGYRFSSKNVRLYNNTNLNMISFDTISGAEFSKNKLRVSSIEVPLMLGFSFGNKRLNKGFKLAIGVLGTYTYSSKYKLNFDKDNESTQQVIRDNFHIRPFNVKATARIGYKGLMFFANYSLLSMFKDNQGPNIKPFEIGIVL